MKGIATFFAIALLSAAGASPARAADPTLEVAPNLVFNGQTVIDDRWIELSRDLGPGEEPGR